MQPTWKDPMATPEGELLMLVKSIEKASGCEPSAADYKSDRGDKEMPKLPKSKKGKHTKEKKVCKTTEFLQSKGVLVKYEQEGSIDNSVPVFQDHSGGIPVSAVNYSTNQVVPDYRTEAPKKTFISEKAQIPSVSQTGYDEKGSSLHMHLIDGGNRSLGNWNQAPIEESLTQLKKAGGYGNPGIVDEIADLIEKVAKRLQ